LIIDNAKMRSFNGLPLVTSIWPGDPFPGVWIFDHSDLIPDDTTDIEIVENQSRAPLRVAIDGRRIPSLATWRTNTFAIEIVSNIARRPASGVRGKDAPNDGRFLLDNLQLPRMTQNSAIAVSPSACMAAIADYAGHSTAHLFGAVVCVIPANCAWLRPDVTIDSFWRKPGIEGKVLDLISSRWLDLAQTSP
jgi:hypothetical protein